MSYLTIIYASYVFKNLVADIFIINKMSNNETDIMAQYILPHIDTITSKSAGANIRTSEVRKNQHVLEFVLY
jgi:hypothetical protein